MAKDKFRASNGMGSVRQRKDGRWEGRYMAPDGRQKSVYAKTKAECAKALRAAQTKIDGGNWREPSKLTVGEWLRIWLDDYQSDTSERTIKKYRCILEKHFIPTIGTVKMRSLGNIHVTRIINVLKSVPLADSTIRNYMLVFSASLNQAVRSKIIAENPASNLKLSARAKKEFHIVDRQQLPDFFKAAQKTLYPYELSFGILSGLRVGELRGLRWIDVDFDTCTINVRQQLQPKNKGLKRFTLPKYDKTRKFHVPAEAMRFLREQKKRQAEQRIACGERWKETDVSKGLVFRKADGSEHGEHTIAFALRAVGKEIGIPDLHPHDLRHSYAVAALRAGADVKTVQHNLGHATVQMTLNVYAAYTQDAGQQSAQKLSLYLQNLNI